MTPADDLLRWGVIAICILAALGVGMVAWAHSHGRTRLARRKAERFGPALRPWGRFH